MVQPWLYLPYRLLRACDIGITLEVAGSTMYSLTLAGFGYHCNRLGVVGEHCKPRVLFSINCYLHVHGWLYPSNNKIIATTSCTKLFTMASIHHINPTECGWVQLFVKMVQGFAESLQQKLSQTISTLQTPCCKDSA